jgi:hypothetical protein
MTLNGQRLLLTRWAVSNLRAPRDRRFAGHKPTPKRAMLTGIPFVLRTGIVANFCHK